MYHLVDCRGQFHFASNQNTPEIEITSDFDNTWEKVKKKYWTLTDLMSISIK